MGVLRSSSVAAYESALSQLLRALADLTRVGHLDGQHARDAVAIEWTRQRFRAVQLKLDLMDAEIATETYAQPPGAVAALAVVAAELEQHRSRAAEEHGAAAADLRCEWEARHRACGKPLCDHKRAQQAWAVCCNAAGCRQCLTCGFHLEKWLCSM